MNGEYPRRLGELWIRKESEQTAVFDPVSGQLFQLNASALAIWELCDGQTAPEEVTDAIVELTGQPRADVALEVSATIDRLLQLGLLIADPGRLVD